jgi:alkylation response protein AidB-like acyl-CoA dehydrogenase
MVDGLSRCELVFENCFVPEENVLGQEGKGSFILFSCVSFKEDLCKMFDV